VNVHITIILILKLCKYYIKNCKNKLKIPQTIIKNKILAYNMFQDIEPMKNFSKEKNIENGVYLDNKTYLNIVSDIKSSKYREKALKILIKPEEVKTPSEMSKILGIEVSHTCKILKDLKDHGLIICINEKDKKNKKHKISKLGKNIGNTVIKSTHYEKV